MKLLRDRPYLLLWLVTIPFLLIALTDSQRPIELLIGQTIIGMTVSQFVTDSVAILLSISFVYWLLSLTNKRIPWGCAVTHIVLTSGSLLLIALPLFSNDALVNRELVDLTKSLFLVGQLFFGIAIIWTLLNPSINK